MQSQLTDSGIWLSLPVECADPHKRPVDATHDCSDMPVTLMQMSLSRQLRRETWTHLSTAYEPAGFEERLELNTLAKRYNLTKHRIYDSTYSTGDWAPASVASQERYDAFASYISVESCNADERRQSRCQEAPLKSRPIPLQGKKTHSNSLDADAQLQTHVFETQDQEHSAAKARPTWPLRIPQNAPAKLEVCGDCLPWCEVVHLNAACRHDPSMFGCNAQDDLAFPGFPWDDERMCGSCVRRLIKALSRIRVVKPSLCSVYTGRATQSR